jgi:succinate dehydrogenase/fumarate reductase flavoprotein subunit
MKTNLDGLYAAGDCVMGGNGHAQAAATGKYAGRKAAEYALVASEPLISRKQVDTEKSRVYSPLQRQDGIDWKELNFGINKVMQIYCSDPKHGELMNLGLRLLDDLKEEAASDVYATDPHKLGRCLEVMDVLTFAEIIMHACLARRASSSYLSFYRWDYPEKDPPEWRKFITVKLEDGEVKVDQLPLNFWGDLKENYEAHCAK